MLLRDRQKVFVENCVSAIKSEGNTLGVAPTGAGKTVMLAAIAAGAQNPKLPTLVLQHRDELVTQNARTYVNFLGKRTRPAIINAERKAWDRRPGGFNFAMVQTLVRNLDDMPKVGLLQIDECHHVAANSYTEIIHAARKKNPDLLIYGTTATPNRGDNKALRATFDNCADQITVGELISAGHLVRPRTFVIDLGVKEGLEKVRRLASDFDMQAVEKIMNSDPINSEVIRHWKEKAGDRQTIVFCSTVAHANDVLTAFLEAGVPSAMIDGKMSSGNRRETLKAYDRGEFQVIINVAVLTEGFDHQPTSCVILLRPSSWKSTMIQMIGRGLRKVDPERYPGVQKDDCIVLDFGTSILTHGSLEDQIDLKSGGTKTCPDCEVKIPSQCSGCPICGYEWPKTAPDEGPGGGGERTKGGEDIASFVMSEVDIIDSSPFRYEDLFDGRVQLCSAFTAWACIAAASDGRFYAVGGRKDEDNRTVSQLLANASDRIVALQSADDWMRTHGDASAAQKSKRWLTAPPTPKQLEILGLSSGIGGMGTGLTKYRAGCMIEWKFNQTRIGRIVENAIRQLAA